MFATAPASSGDSAAFFYTSPLKAVGAFSINHNALWKSVTLYTLTITETVPPNNACSFWRSSSRASRVQKVRFVASHCLLTASAAVPMTNNSIVGVIYEKRLIEQYINEHGTEPSTGEALTADDLLPINSSRIARPRPPTLTSIPALLATFQNEWDSLALETYNLREQLARTREELATSLYQHDAAVRVIARLTKERNEARDTLSRITVSGAGANSDEMVVDTEGLPDALAARVDEVHQEYVTEMQFSATRLTLRSGFPRVARSALFPRTGSPLTKLPLSRSQLRTRCQSRRQPAWIRRVHTLLLVACKARELSTLWRPTPWSERLLLASLPPARYGLAPS